MTDVDLTILGGASDAAEICRAQLEKHGIPAQLQPGLVRYLVDGIRPGSFLAAVLENNLAEAVMRANPDEHFQALPGLVRFLNLQAPAESWGSRAKVEAWARERKVGRRA